MADSKSNDQLVQWVTTSRRNKGCPKRSKILDCLLRSHNSWKRSQSSAGSYLRRARNCGALRQRFDPFDLTAALGPAGLGGQGGSAHSELPGRIAAAPSVS